MMPNSVSHNGKTAKHVAIIMDGNGRWAKARGLPRTEGHRRGIEAVKRTVEAARELQIPYITLFGFSTENWSRPEEEVSELMGLLRFYLRSETAELHKNGVRLRVIGETDRFAKDIRELIDHAETLTAGNTNHNLTVALGYGGRQDILRAAKNLAQSIAAGEIKADQVDEILFSRELFTHELPDPDMIIRTSGEKRISNFLLWQCAYAELVFLDALWPDFDKTHLEAALAEFSRRDRRYGRTASR